MHQIKIFKGIENDTRTLEEEVNRWMRDRRAKVVHVFGNMSPQTSRPDPSRAGENAAGLTQSTFAPSDIFLVVVYEV
jgi:hypothetical protein